MYFVLPVVEVLDLLPPLQGLARVSLHLVLSSGGLNQHLAHLEE